MLTNIYGHNIQFYRHYKPEIYFTILIKELHSIMLFKMQFKKLKLKICILAIFINNTL